MEQLENARIMIESNRHDTSLSLERPNSDLRCNWRLSSHNHDTIDLHGTRVAEAVVIVKEILQRDGCSPSKPLKIVTGRGTHSANRVGVLKPAVKTALLEDGWDVGQWDGGLTVKGKRRASSR